MEASDFSAGAAYVQGRFVPIGQATIGVTDFAFTRSDVVYDVVHVVQGGFFRLDDHLDRFTRSMQRKRLKLPEGREAVADVLHRCVALAGLSDAYVAMVAARGRPRVAGSRRPSDCDNHLIAYAVPWVNVMSPEIQERGAHVWISSTPRVPDASKDPTVKNYQWNDFTESLWEAEEHGFDTAILCDADGFITEGAGFNIFIVRGGKVSTPDRGSLHGITRLSVLELCADMKVPASIVPITRAELEEADEVFAATTAGGVMPIARVGSRIFSNDRPGLLSEALKEAYWRRHDEGWHRTPVKGLAAVGPSGVGAVPRSKSRACVSA